jgi:hypothetical protein
MPNGGEPTYEFGTLGFRDRTQAVVVAYESGLVTPRSREPV